MKVYMIRHGESEANKGKFHGGWLQINLTEKGIADAKHAGEYLSGIKFDKIYTSDLIRAIQTAEHALPGCEYEIISLVREVCLGSLAGRYPADCLAEYGEDYLINKKNRDYRPTR